MAENTDGGDLRMKLRNANPAARVTGVDELAGTSNYFIGNDPTKWRTNVPTYGKVKYVGIYSGIDLVYYGNQRQLEYDFIVAPGADPRRIAFDILGAKRIRRDAHEDLVFKIGEDEIRWHKPVVYQERDGTRQLVAARYAITDKNRVGFELASYDVSRPLYIDPLIYSTYLGGSGADDGFGIAIDGAGNAYIAGSTSSTNFPVQPGSYQATYGGSGDAFVTKINPTGSAFVFSTYLGGSGVDEGTSIAVDSASSVYVTGGTSSTDFPTTPGAFQTTGGPGFVTKLNPTGSGLVYSTYLSGGGSSGIAVDSAGDAYLTGSTYCPNDFPTTTGAFQTTCASGTYTGFVAKFNPTGSGLIYATFLGGGSDGIAGVTTTTRSSGLAIDSAGNAYLTGWTTSTSFPTTPGAFQTICDDGNACAYDCDTFVSKLNPTGSGLVYSTYLGGSGAEIGSGISIDNASCAYVTGETLSTNFPTTPGAFQTTNYTSGYDWDGFVSKLNPTGSGLVYSTYLGGTDMGTTFIYGIAVDSSGEAYVAGYTSSTHFPTVNPVQKKRRSSVDAFVSRFNPNGSGLLSSTYVGGSADDVGFGIAVDSNSEAYVTGYTTSINFPTFDPLQPANGGGQDVFVFKLDTRPATTTALSSSPNPSGYEQAVTFTAVVTSSAGSPPDGETVTFMKGATVLGAGTLSGGPGSFSASAGKGGANDDTG